jgi:DNA-binding transcriptional ArsR family regulator
MSAIRHAVQMHKAIGHPVRLRLLAMLRGGPLCVCQMTGVLELAGSTVSEHLSELRNAGILTERKSGRWVEYRLADNEVARRVVDATWTELQDDPDIEADAVVVRELRHIPVEELCGADLHKIDRPKLARMLAKAAKLRGQP